MDAFYHARQKSTINELDVEERLATFPVEWLGNVNWLAAPVKAEDYRMRLNTIANDFLLGKDNSLGQNKQSIEDARPLC